MSSPCFSDLEGGDVRALIEELRRRELQNPVLLGDVEDAVAREADAIRDLELDGRREHLHLVGDAILVAIRDGIDVVLARADEDHAGIRPTAMCRASGTRA